VASCGTALTGDQAHLLRRFTRKVVVAYDGDTAGQEASLRSISVLLEHGIDVFIAGLPGGEDPDSFLKQHGAAEFTRLIESAEPFFTYLLSALRSRIDTRSPQGKNALCREVFPLLARLENELVREGYLDELAAFVEIDRQRLARAFAETTRRQPRRERSDNRARPVPELARDLPPAEKELLAHVLHNEQALAYAHTHLDAEDVSHPRGYAIIRAAFDAYKANEWPGFDVFLTHLNEDDAALVTDLLCGAPAAGDDWKPIISDCIAVLHNRAYDAEIARLTRELDSAEPERQQELLKAIQDYQRLKQPRVKRADFGNTP
jgi:DNA primase